MKHARFTDAFLLFYVSTREMKIKHTLAFKIFFFVLFNAPEMSKQLRNYWNRGTQLTIKI